MVGERVLLSWCCGFLGICGTTG